VFAKDVSADKNPLAQVVEPKVVVTESVDKKQVIPEQTVITELKKRLDDLDSQKLEREKVEVERNRKSIDWWFSALAIMTTIVAALGALFPFLMARKDKELLKVELAGVKNDRADIQRMKDDVQKVLNESKTDSAEIKAHKVESERDRTIVKNRLPDIMADSQQMAAIIKTADRVMKSPDSSAIETLRAQAVKASEEQDNDLALLLWQRILSDISTDLQASFYYANCVQKKYSNSDNISWHEFNSIVKAYSAAEANDISANKELKNFWIPNNWGNTLADYAEKISDAQPTLSQELRNLAQEKYSEALIIKPDYFKAIMNWGTVLADEANHIAKSDLQAAKILWEKSKQKYLEVLKINPNMHLATYGLACLNAIQNNDDLAVDQLDFLRKNYALPKHWLNDDDFVALRTTQVYKQWFIKHFVSIDK
jgi:hypothetical protein